MEQWEINLRNELAGKKEKPVVYSQNLSMPNSNHNILIVALIVLGLAVLFTFNYKTGVITNFFNGEKIEKIEETNQSEEEKSLETPSSDLQDIKLELEKISSKVKFNNDRIVLMGLLLNENFSILRGDKDKSDLVFFDRKWKLKTWPKNISLTDEDKEWLKKYIVETEEN